MTSVPRLLATSALVVCVVGMMLVIGGVVTGGLFLPGVLLIGVGLLGFGAAAAAELWTARR